LKETDLWDGSEQVKYWKTSKREGRATKKSKWKDCEKKEATGEFYPSACMKWK
jgi:hypothetical protein